MERIVQMKCFRRCSSLFSAQHDCAALLVGVRAGDVVAAVDYGGGVRSKQCRSVVVARGDKRCSSSCCCFCSVFDSRRGR